MKYSIILLSSLSLCMCTRLKSGSSDSKIVNGKLVDRGDFPGIAQLRVPEGTCTAAKISPTLWLTAAHCVVDYSNRPDAISLTMFDGQLLRGQMIFLPNRILDGSAVAKDANGITRITDPTADVVAIKTVSTSGSYYSIGPFSTVSRTTILGFGVASSCDNLQRDRVNPDLAIEQNCKATRDNSRAGRLRGAYLNPAQLNAVNDDVVTVIGPIVPDNSGIAGPGFGDSGSPLIQGNDMIVGTLYGSQFDSFSSRSPELGLAENNRLLAIYVHSQSVAFCEVLQGASQGQSLQGEQIRGCESTNESATARDDAGVDVIKNEQVDNVKFGRICNSDGLDDSGNDCAAKGITTATNTLGSDGKPIAADGLNTGRICYSTGLDDMGDACKFCSSEGFDELGIPCDSVKGVSSVQSCNSDGVDKGGVSCDKARTSGLVIFNRNGRTGKSNPLLDDGSKSIGFRNNLSTQWPRGQRDFSRAAGQPDYISQAGVSANAADAGRRFEEQLILQERERNLVNGQVETTVFQP